MKELQEIINIIEVKKQGIALKNLLGCYEEAIEDNGIDKKAAVFVGLSDLRAFKVTACFEIYTGRVGSSSISRFGPKFDGALIQKHFVEYLNKHKAEILEGIAGSILEEAKNKSDKAKALLESLSEQVAALSDEQ